MKGLKGSKIGLVGAALAALAAVGVILATQAFAASGSLTVTDGNAAPSARGSVDVVSDVTDPGLGAATFNITYDASVISVADVGSRTDVRNPVDQRTPDGTVDQYDCPLLAGTGACNPNAGAGTIRVSFADANGIIGSDKLVTIYFKCASAAGTSALTLHPEIFSDASLAAPAPIAPATMNNGSFTCAVQPTHTAVRAAATATPAAHVIVSTGTGGFDGGNGMGWIIVALAAVGLAGIAGVGAIRLRRSA